MTVVLTVKGMKMRMMMAQVTVDVVALWRWQR